MCRFFLRQFFRDAYPELEYSSIQRVFALVNSKALNQGKSYCIFVSVFSIHRCLFGSIFTNICIFFAVYYVRFIKTSNSVLGTKSS